MSATKLKRNACEGCFKSRVKCEYTSPDGLRCARCIRQNRECIPRVVLRGKAKQESLKSGLSDLDLNAYRSAAIFEDLPHLSLHLSAASSLVKTYKSLGLDKPPTSLKWTINSMFLIATIEKSLGLLHTSTTLAVSTSTPIDVQVLNPQHSPLTEEMKDVYENEIYEKFIKNDQAGACFILRTDGGDRAIMANSQFEFFFETADSMAARLSRSPHFRLWRKFLVKTEDADKFTSRMVKSWLMAGEPGGNPPAIRWSCSDLGETKIRDSKDNIYLATLFEFGLIAGEGFLSFLVFGFKNIRPLSASGEARIEQFKMEHSQQLPARVPSLARLDSVWSVLLPEPMSTPNTAQSAVPPSAPSPSYTPATRFQQPAMPSPAPLQSQYKQEQQVPMSQQLQQGGAGYFQQFPGDYSVQGQQQQLVPQQQDLLSSTGSGESNDLPRGESSDSQGSATNSLAMAGEDTASQGIRSISSFDWEDGLVKLDSDDLWNSFDYVIENVGGTEELKNGNWTH